MNTFCMIFVNLSNVVITVGQLTIQDRGTQNINILNQ